jgi:hypothetical protein
VLAAVTMTWSAQKSLQASQDRSRMSSGGTVATSASRVAARPP